MDSNHRSPKNHTRAQVQRAEIYSLPLWPLAYLPIYNVVPTVRVHVSLRDLRDVCTITRFMRRNAYTVIPGRNRTALSTLRISTLRDPRSFFNRAVAPAEVRQMKELSRSKYLFCRFCQGFCGLHQIRVGNFLELRSSSHNFKLSATLLDHIEQLVDANLCGVVSVIWSIHITLSPFMPPELPKRKPFRYFIHFSQAPTRSRKPCGAHPWSSSPSSSSCDGSACSRGV